MFTYEKKLFVHNKIKLKRFWLLFGLFPDKLLALIGPKTILGCYNNIIQKL